MRLLLVVGVYASLWTVCPTEDIPVSVMAIARSMSTSSNSSENLLFSPLSMQVVLAMCYVGAVGETAKQLAKALRLPHGNDLVTSGFKHVLQTLLTKENVMLEVAIKIFAANKFQINKPFAATVEKFFASEIESANYTYYPAKAANFINKWVDKKTNSKIPDIVSKGDLSEETSMVLLNVVYFKGLWETAFDEKKPSRNVSSGKVEKVDMMICDIKVRFEEREDIGATILEIPYKNKGTSFVIVLPIEMYGLAGVEEKLQKMNLKKVLTCRQVMNVQISLPRFSLELSSSLDEVLMGLGMTDMFSPRANFSGMSLQEGHKSRIDVNEKGTEAAPVTAEKVETKEFVVNRPFLFALVSRRTGVVIFMGRFATPQRLEPHVTFKSKGFKPKPPSRGKTGGVSLAHDCSRFWGAIVVLMFIVSHRLQP